MQTQNPSLAKTLNLHSSSSSTFFNPLHRYVHSTCSSFRAPKPLRINCLNTNASRRRDVRLFAGRKKDHGGTGAGFVEANAHLLREAQREARRKNKKYVEGLFYRLKNPHKNYPDNFTEDELEMMGLGYDRMVQFMEKDDPNLKHPHDWYKYGEFGPYSWRGIVLGEPVRGRFTDDCVSMFGEVRDQEEWEKIEQFDMARDYQTRLDNEMNQDVKFRYFWVFVRHPRWKVTELPWQQWTLVCEVVMEAGDQRLDKWSLMGRLGNKSRANIAQCAAWMRPDIIYVKRPVFQCRFEPQEGFFQPLVPYLDPETERDYMFELVNDEGRVETCTYFGGLCKMVKVRQKAFVDDVVKAYEKLSDDKKSRVLEFLLNNHPVQLLHPYTKEWKAKLEEMELGCDAPDEDEVSGGGEGGEIVDWIEDDGKNDHEEAVSDAEEVDDDDDEILGIKEEDSEEEDVDDFNPQEEFKKAIGSNEEMEKFARRSMEARNKRHEKEARQRERNGDHGDVSAKEKFATRAMEDKNKRYEQHTREMEEMEAEEEEEDGEEEDGDGDELALRGKRAKVEAEEWRYLGYGPFRKRVQKSKAPPGKFLRAAVRPFTYRNLVKEIVLLRHAIIDGEIVTKKK